MKTILYATNCTDNDAHALKYAYRFSSILGANLHVLHVYNLPPIAFSTINPTGSLKKRMHEERMHLLEKYCKKHLKNEFHQNPITTHVVESDSVSASISRLSKVITPDLVIIGMKDSHSNRGYFAGNIANTLLDTITVPLLIVPNSLVYETISTIVYATDFEEVDILSLQKITEIAKPFSALIEVVHVYETDDYPANKYMERFKEAFLKDRAYPEIIFKTMASSSIKSGLLRVLNNEKASMLTMLERKHDWSFSNIFQKDLVKDMEMSLKIPLLVFNKHNKTFQNEGHEYFRENEMLSMP
ncbi:universal stress protein [Algibacter mikhailovii]|uniref:universal stress protein n=1 Tax=Algibacter mikhailovii TaxID=425498 RepID=UPI002494474E|nr:universal stress protein [Algibacter mikhailovii]